MLDGIALLDVWERGRHAPIAARLLQLLAVAAPSESRESLEQLDLASCDWRLLGLRVAWFGERLAASAECDRCGETLEAVLDGGAIAAAPPGAPGVYVCASGQRFRLATLGDLLAIDDMRDRETATRALFARCAVDGLGDVPADLFDEADRGLLALASERAVLVHLACAACGGQSCRRLDPAEFLWSEIASAAARLFDDVHRLARAYGWSERDILALSPARRAAYVGRVP